MSNTTNALGHSITVTGIPATRQFDTRQNVKKRLFTFRFNSGIPNSGINMAYASVDEIHADTNLFISDKSTSINENSPGFLVEEETFLGPSYTTFFKNFLMTDVFTPAEVTRPSEPLYFRHTLDSSIDENSISILDKNFSPIDGSLYVIQKPYTYSIVDGDPNDDSDVDHALEYEAVYVYNNLEHSFDAETGDYEVYYVSHVDATTGNVVTELLSNNNVFHQAGFGDIWVVTSQLEPWGKAYLIEETNGTYELTLPTTGTYSIQSLDAARIFITEPVTKESVDPWFARVTNGSFRTTHNALQYVYSLPEFSAQSFNPIEPYKLIINERSERITNNLIKLNHNKIYHSLFLHFYIDIVITDEEDNPLFAITTDPERLGTNYIDSVGTTTDIMWDDEAFDSLDARHGFIYLDTIIKDSYNVTTTYYFEEEYYEFTTINFNPTQNINILTERVVLYLVPENSTHNSNTAHTGALHFLKVASDGLITFTSQDGTDGNENLKSGSAYMLEAGSRHSIEPGGLGHIFWVNSPELNAGMYYDSMPTLGPNATVPSDPAGVAHMFAVYPKPGPGVETFVDTFTVNAASSKSGLDKRYIVLGEIFVNDHTSPDEVKILDTRVRGGGVREDRLTEALHKNPEVQWYNDIGIYDGRPFPGTSAIVIKVPYTVLDEYGGILSRKQVRETIKRHMALGSEPVIRYDGVIPYLTSIVPDANRLTIQWDSEGSSYGYNVYYSTSKDGPYIKYNSTLITDNALGNELEMTGLTNRVKYWVTAAAVNIASGLEGPRAVALIARPEVIPKKLKAAMGHSVSVVI